MSTVDYFKTLIKINFLNHTDKRRHTLQWCQCKQMTSKRGSSTHWVDCCTTWQPATINSTTWFIALLKGWIATVVVATVILSNGLNKQYTDNLEYSIGYLRGHAVAQLVQAPC